jgi:hypothetical protein
LILNGIVTAYQTATPPTYFYDYSDTGVVSLARETLAARLEKPSEIAVRVRDGAEKHGLSRARGGVTTLLDVLVEITVRAAPDVLVASMADALSDLSLMIGANAEPGDPEGWVKLESVEAPIYDFSGKYAVAIAHLRSERDYQPGVDT